MKVLALKLDKFFKIKERGSTIAKEILGGLTIFLAMVYVLPVNADMLSQTGMSFAAVFAATAIAAAIASLVMGLLANYPVGLASGMGVNAFFTYTVVLTLQFTWQEALAAVLISGVIFLVISITGLRKLVINAIPKNLKLAVGAGIGFFIAFIGLKNAGIVVSNAGTYVSLGDLGHPTVLLGIFGIVLVFILFAIKKKLSRFAIIISIVVTGILGVIIGLIFPSVASLMPSIGGSNLGGIGDIGLTFGQAFKAIPSLLSNPLSYAVIFTFLFVDFFDTAGTLVAVGHDAGLLDKNGELIDGEKALLADATGTIVGAVLGTSTVTSYIESTTGIQSGARTGLAAVMVGLLFIISLIFYPLFSIVGSVMVSSGVFYSPVTAMALVFVGTLMFSSLKEIDWSDGIVVATTFITIITMTLAFSIAEGIAFGFIFYVIMMLATPRRKEVSPVMYVLAGLFVINFIIKVLFFI
ncbi:MAG: NCS2 family permease [Firmicutes bacterium]|nr:NCS2 family permease [Bacillota bacterium]